MVDPKPGDRVLALRLHREANHGHHYYVPAIVVAIGSRHELSGDRARDGRGTGGVIACGGYGDEPDAMVRVRYEEPFQNGWGTVTSEVALHISRIRPVEASE
ncbi:MAG: hypothetical protein H0V92_01145 [Pseudonocardiales bacterium]|nr:hypothetical protein [Pseudonocardiales bacterium]